MKKWILLSAMALSVSCLFAQGGGPPSTPTPADRVARLTTLLTLTAAQQAQATTIFTIEDAAMATVRPSIQAARAALQAAVKTNDTGTITLQATQLGNLTAQDLIARSTADAAFYAILTADQKTKYDELHLSGPGGPGGAGGPRGPGGAGAFGARGPRG